MKKAVAAVSGGPDSMALLDQLVHSGLDVTAVHVNYHKRDSASRDQKIVEDYCQKHQIGLEIIDGSGFLGGNFQDWARKLRYDAFFQTARKIGAEDIYVAHHLDDHIETFLMQKQGNRLADTFGLSSVCSMQGFAIHRPFLELEKKQLIDYCLLNQIEYGIDESNLGNDYTRNKIRHEQVEKLSLEEKREMAKTIQKKNEQWQAKKAEIESEICDHSMSAELLKKEDGWLYLDRLLFQAGGRHYAKSHLLSLSGQLKPGVLVRIDNIDVENYRGRLIALPAARKPVFKAENMEELSSLSVQSAPLSYTIKMSGKTIESFWLDKDDFPLTVRPYRKGDAIELRNGRKKVSRFFIDRHIPRILRQYWPVVENAAGDIIFVSGIGCDVSHFSKNECVSMLQWYTIKF